MDARKKQKKGSPTWRLALVAALGLFLFGIWGGAPWIYEALQVAQMPKESRAYAKKCQSREDFDCCMASIDVFYRPGKDVSSLLESPSDQQCAPRFRARRLACRGSLVFCVNSQASLSQKGEPYEF